MRKAKYIFSVLILIICTLISTKINAQEITNKSDVQLDGKSINKKVLDNKESTYITISKENEIEIKAAEDIYSIYIVYEFSSKTGTITGNDKTAKIGENSFLHEYIDVKEKLGVTKELKLKYDQDVKIADVYVIGEGEIPEFVEIWNTSYEKADLLLFSTHSDDEQLFFLGLMPTYVAKGAYVQVVYFTNHNDNPKRLHEQLHGLYTVGIRNYPVFGIVPDAYSESLEGAIKNLKAAKLTEEEAEKFQVENIRRFKPQVVVGHDEKGEYSHGQHILNTYLLEDAITKANDPSYDEASKDKYGTWQISKLYLHLYEKNQIKMDYDTPLEYFDGRTAYEVSKEGYSKHLSQQWTWFTKWINGPNNSFKKATEIKKYSPLDYGLYYTGVGEDIQKNDMFENIVYYKDQIKQEEIKKPEIIEEEQNEEDNKIENKYSAIFIYIVIAFVVIAISVIIIKKKQTKKKRARSRKKSR